MEPEIFKKPREAPRIPVPEALRSLAATGDLNPRKRRAEGNSHDDAPGAKRK